ncbi:MAG: molecular chaperone DnaK [bacterium]
MSRSVGIDFGTTNSAIAVMEGGEPKIIPNRRGERLTPSVVAFTKDDEVLIGTSAKNQSIINFERTISSIKRRFGTDCEILVSARRLIAPQIASLIIAHLKEDAEHFLDEKVDSAVITVPAYFTDAQRQDVKAAGEMAGLRVLRLINEPTAAALAYGLPRGAAGTIAIFDLGGGTFDISILDISREVFEVIATRGNNHLGGDDFDARLVSCICDSFYREHGIDLRDDRMAFQKVREAAETAKIELSSAASTTVSLPFISADISGPKHLNLEITRLQFEDLITDYLDAIGQIVDDALDDAGMSVDEIDSVLLVGGSTRIPRIQQMLESKFSRVRRSINPDEAVALGAAIQAGILTGSVRGLVLVDVAPMSLGIETENDVFVPIIERNSSIPTSRSRIFTTVVDNQTLVEVKVLQGERPQASKNFELGRFVLTGIKPAMRGAPRIEVLFDIDADGLVHVLAKDMETGSYRSIQIDPTRKVSVEETHRMIEDVETYREEDEAFRKRARITRQARDLLEKLRDKMIKEGEQWVQYRPEIFEVIGEFEETLGREDMEQLQIVMETMSGYLGDVPMPPAL